MSSTAISAPPPPGDLRGYLLTREVCEQLRVSPNTLRAWIEAGMFPRPRRIGRHTYHDPREIREFLDRSRGGAGHVEA